MKINFLLITLVNPKNRALFVLIKLVLYNKILKKGGFYDKKDFVINDYLDFP